MSFLKTSAHVLAIVALSAAGATPALATEWEKLQSSGWSGDKAATDEGTAATDAASGGQGADITAAFTSMGMNEARAACFGETIAAQLSADHQAEAAELVRAASDSTEVREAVMNAGPDMVGAFSAANETCPEGMG